MKDQADIQTIDLFPIKRGPGRPSTGSAKSNAERQKAYRRRKAPGQVPSKVVETDLAATVAELRAQLAEMERDRDRWRGMYDIALKLEPNPELERLRVQVAELWECNDVLIKERDEARKYNVTEIPVLPASPVQDENKKCNVTENKLESDSVPFYRLEKEDYAKRCQGMNRDRTRCRGKGGRGSLVRLDDGRVGHFCSCRLHESDFRPHPTVLRNVTKISGLFE